MASLTAEHLINLLHLEPLPVEGGYYRQTYLAQELFEPTGSSLRAPGPRSACSAIYYLLHGQNFSALHRLQTDELFHFYLGDPVQMLLLYPDGSAQHPILGPDLENGQHLQFVVPKGVWQGSQLLSGGRFGLLGTTMAPAYTRADFEIGFRDQLIQQYPAESFTITQLTH